MEPDKYQLDTLHVIMAGTGNPYAVLTPLRIRLLRSLHDGLSLTEIGRLFSLTAAELAAELQALLSVTLLHKNADTYQPAFLMANKDETRHVTNHAEQVGEQLADYLVQVWPQLEKAFARLTVSGIHSFSECSFFLVGDKLLDTTLLDVLAQDQSFMPPAPARPTPSSPHDRYYFWMIEGDHDQLGKYGQRTTPLPWPDWQLLTFGQYKIAGKLNITRNEIEKNIMDAVTTANFATAAELANVVHVPAFAHTETDFWLQTVRPHAAALVNVYQQHEQTIRELYESLQAANYKGQNFGEFFCWYDHVAYAAAIDHLIEAGLMTRPNEGFTAALWHEDSAKKYF